MSEPEQLPLFEMEPDWRKEWQDMPEFERFDNRPFQQIIVNFKTREDVKAFSKAIGQKLTCDTDTIWYPPYKTKTGLFVDES